MIERVFYNTHTFEHDEMLAIFAHAGKVCKSVVFRRNLSHFVGDVRDVCKMIHDSRHAIFYALKETTADGFVEYEIGCRFCRFGDDDSVCNIRMTEERGMALFEQYGFMEAK